MSDARRSVRLGAGAGVILLYGTLALSYRWLPAFSPAEEPGLGARLATAAHLALYPAALIFILTVVIGLARIRRGFIDPLAGPGDDRLEVDRRVLSNTVEQGLVFVLSLAALATRVPHRFLAVLPLLVMFFVAARIAFWIGYRIRPEHRAAGMAMTYNLNIVTIALALIC